MDGGSAPGASARPAMWSDVLAQVVPSGAQASTVAPSTPGMRATAASTSEVSAGATSGGYRASGGGGHRQGRLDHDDRPSRIVAPKRGGGTGRTRSAVAEGGREGESRRTERRGEPREERGEQRRAEREGEDARVDRRRGELADRA